MIVKLGYGILEGLGCIVGFLTGYINVTWNHFFRSCDFSVVILLSFLVWDLLCGILGRLVSTIYSLMVSFIILLSLLAQIIQSQRIISNFLSWIWLLNSVPLLLLLNCIRQRCHLFLLLARGRHKLWQLQSVYQSRMPFFVNFFERPDAIQER